jgi:hypothetical protein
MMDPKEKKKVMEDMAKLQKQLANIVEDPNTPDIGKVKHPDIMKRLSKKSLFRKTFK